MVKLTKKNLIELIKSEIANLTESTDAHDYNEIAIEQLYESVVADSKAWMRTHKIMEHDDTYKIVQKYGKIIDKIMKKCDKDLRRLR
jgi:hypothetical protein